MNPSYAYTPYILPLLASAAFTVVLLIYVWRRRAVPGALPLVVAMLCSLMWIGGATLELAAVDVTTKVFWIKFQSLWLIPTNTAVLCFFLEYAAPGRWVTRRTLTLLAIPILLNLLWVLTNDASHWLWLDFPYATYVSPVYGTGTWVLITYSYFLAVLQVCVLVWLAVVSPQHRWPVVLMLIARIVAFIAYRLDVTNANPVAPVDPTALTFTFTAAVYALALFRFHMLNIMPVARDTVFERMTDGVLVLDAANHIADLNPAAQQLLGVSRPHVIGRTAAQALAAYPNLIEPVCSSRTLQLELPLDANAVSRCYRVSCSSLADRRGFVLGRMVMLQDITEVKHAQELKLNQQRAIATLQERDRVARELHDSLGQVLGYVKLQTQAARTLLAHSQPTEADAYLAQLIAVVQEAHVDVREYILGARVGLTTEAGLMPALDQYLRRFGETYGIATELHAPPDITDDLFEPTVEVQLLRIIQEALTNVRKHAQARKVRVSLSLYDSQVAALVHDDGIGFDMALLETVEGQKFGLGFMRDRAAEVGGSVEIHSAPDSGTRVSISVPRRKDAL